MKQYSDEVRRFFFNRQYAGDLEGLNVYKAQAGALINGDVVCFMLKIEEGCVQDVRYKVFGQVLTVAACAFFAPRVIGLRVDEIAEAVSWQNCLEALALKPEQQSPLILVSAAICQAAQCYLTK